MAISDGPQAGLDLVDQLNNAGLLTRYHLVTATRQTGCAGSVVTARQRRPTDRALDLATSDADRRFLARRLDELPR